MDNLTWNGKSHREFIDKTIPKFLRQKHGMQLKPSLVIEPLFINGYSALDDEGTGDLLEALAAIPIGVLFFEDGPVDRHYRGRTSLTKVQAHFDRLYDCLGSITTIKTVHFHFRNDFDRKILPSRLISRLLAVENVTVWDYEMDDKDEERIIDLARGFRDHPSIQTLDLDISPSHYHDILPALPSMSSLKEVTLRGTNQSYEPSYVIRPEQAYPIAAVFKEPGSFVVKLRDLNFAYYASQGILCNGITSAQVGGLAVEYCVFQEVSRLITAITASKLKRLSFGRIAFEVPEGQDDMDDEYSDSDPVKENQFFYELIADLPRMSKLEDLVWDFIDEDGTNEEECEEKAVALIEAAAQCFHLRVLDMKIESLTTDTDEALAECLRNGSKLEEINIRGYSETFEFQDLCDAIQTNFMLKNVSLSGVYWGEDEHQMELKRGMDIFLKLNRAGRARWEADPNNARIVVEVLEQVVDDLDCSFLLLRKCLFMFGSCPAPAKGGGLGKRKRDD